MISLDKELVNQLVEEVNFADLSVAERMQLLRNAVLFPPGKTEMLAETDRRVEVLLQELEMRADLALVKEQPFVSDIPFFGKIIVRIRYAWNWMSTKWWVRSLTEQQNTFNIWVLRLLREVLQMLRVLQDTVSFLHRRDVLAVEVTQLRDEVQALRTQVAALQISPVPVGSTDKNVADYVAES